MSQGKKRHYHQYCGVARALDFVGERWTLLIVRDLLLGPQRYSDLLSGLPGLTTNLLAKRLKGMEDDGLVERLRLPPPAPAALYKLTPLGEDLEPLVQAACDWGTRFLAQPAEEERVSLGWSLLRLKRAYRGGYQLVFEIHCDGRVFHVVLRPEEIRVRLGVNPTSELRITGQARAVQQMFFGPALASDLVSSGHLVVEGKFGRWPRILAAFGLR